MVLPARKGASRGQTERSKTQCWRCHRLRYRMTMTTTNRCDDECWWVQVKLCRGEPARLRYPQAEVAGQPQAGKEPWLHNPPHTAVTSQCYRRRQTRQRPHQTQQCISDEPPKRSPPWRLPNPPPPLPAPCPPVISKHRSRARSLS